MRLGSAVNLTAEELRDAGRYTAILEAGGATSRATFFVIAAQPAEISFLARPSRVPAAAHGAINGSAFVFDKYNNLVLDPRR